MSVVRHTVDYLVQGHWGRMNALGWNYYDIAETSYALFLDAKVRRKPMPEELDPDEYFVNEKQLLTSAFQTIVFSAMACEAAIYDLGAIQLGDDYTTNYLDKLDLLGKWVVVPSLICGKSLRPDGPGINSLRTLTRIRNSLVHHKSLPGLPIQASIQLADKQFEKIIQNTNIAFRTVIFLSLELNRLIGTPSGVLPFFEKDTISFPQKMRHALVLSEIERCREIDARNAL
jgi:hypothetical protein